MALRAGYIGLGNQGMPMASNLAPAGFATTVFDIASEPVEALVKTGAEAAASPREVAERSDVIGVCVPNDAHVLSVCLGEDGVLAGAKSGAVVAIHSTILPETASQVERAAREKGVAVLDACVTGGAARAVQKQLTLLVGGDADAIERARPVLECSAVKIIHAGALGDGAKLKLCINLITYIQWAAAYESFQLAKASGLDTDVLEEAGQSNGQITDLMRAYLNGVKMPEEARQSDGVQALMRNHMNIAEKDLAWALQLARESGVTLPVGGLVSQMMARLYGVEDAGRR